MPKKPPSPPAPLTGKQRSHLRSLAHPLKPVVQIGRQGLTAGVLGALGVAFERHELIKVKLAGDAEVDAEAIAPEIERATRAQVAQIIGHTLVLYRRHDSEPKIVLPRPSKPAKASNKLMKAPVLEENELGAARAGEEDDELGAARAGEEDDEEG